MNNKHTPDTVLQVPANIEQLSVATVIFFRSVYSIDCTEFEQQLSIKFLTKIFRQEADPFSYYLDFCNRMLKRKSGNINLSYLISPGSLYCFLGSAPKYSKKRFSGKKLTRHSMKTALAEAVLELVEAGEPLQFVYWMEWFASCKELRLMLIYLHCIQLFIPDFNAKYYYDEYNRANPDHLHQGYTEDNG